ncbi:MAG: type II toxin-antitoxin system Phd/YefM family antitoxin [Ruminiclostridium sp.]|nr:type II toxin-antitoxin system Phd/YefM family antitoxin [Ruminiclostridium sp.]
MEVPSTKVQNNFGTYLKFAQLEDVFITRNGRKIAVIKACHEDYYGEPVVLEAGEAYKPKDAKMTYEEFMEFSEKSDKRYEFIDGEIYLLSSPPYGHQRIIAEITNYMYQWFKRKKCKPLTAPFDVTLTKFDLKNVVQPDIVVVCDPEKVDEKGRYHGTPTLVVEVLSKSTMGKDMTIKANLYLHSGIREFWVVNPFNKDVIVYLNKSRENNEYAVYKNNETIKSAVFPGLELSLEQIFTE